jgi:hypothetical protein
MILSVIMPPRSYVCFIIFKFITIRNASVVIV